MFRRHPSSASGHYCCLQFRGERSSNQAGVRLRYRRVNQAEAWQELLMARSGAGFRAEIPAAYSDTQFPLQYHFVLEPVGGVPELHPGLKPGWHGQPYFILRQAL